MYYKNRGRPTKEESQILNCPRKLKKSLQDLKQTLSFNDGTEILLAVSMASDGMIRHVQMFPEVFYMDATANTNRQKKQLFLMVVKDGSGECFVGNATIVPSEQMWVYLKIYESFFVTLYGEETIMRNRLTLTDDDESSHTPLDKLSQTSTSWRNSKHALCVFHAIVQPFHKNVYPKMPKKVGNNKVLSDVGRMYCELKERYQFITEPQLYGQ